MLENQLSRYGTISRTVPYLAPGAKMFIVSDSDDTTVGALNIGAEFPVDRDGVVRVYTTIQAASNAAAANRGDVILVLPGYDHTLGRTDSWTTAGVRVIGMGDGTNRPILRYTTATDEVGLSANNIHVENIRFLAAVDSCARALDLDTGFKGQHVSNCVFDFDTATHDFRVMLRLQSRRAVIEGNQFIAEDTAGSGRGISIRGGEPDYSIIRNNYFYGQFDTVGDTSDGGAAIGQDTTDTADTNLSGLVIEKNLIVSTDTAVAAAVRFSAGYTIRGIAEGNRLVSYDCAGTDTVVFALSGLQALNNRIIRSDTTEKLINTAGVAGA